jgi:hypothetical protein
MTGSRNVDHTPGLTIYATIVAGFVSRVIVYRHLRDLS